MIESQMSSLSSYKIFKGFLAFLILFLPVPLVLVSVGVGYLKIPPGEVLKVVQSKLTGEVSEDLKTYEAVIFNIRLPRILLAFLVGATLAVSGAVMQSMFRNPLVEPYILGISSGAAFGASLALGLGITFLTGVQTLAFVFGISSIFLAYVMAKTRGEVPVVNLVLAGIIVTALFSALTSLIKFFVDPHNLAAIVYWIMGSFSHAKWDQLLAVTPMILFPLLLIFAMGWRLNVLSLGEEEAKALGVKVNRDQLVFLSLATFSTSSAVSVSGIIGWVGLLVPHIVRLAFSSDNRVMMPLCASLGGSFMVLADNIARTAFSFELPISVLTTILGAPVFMFLVRRRARRVWS